MGLVLVSANQLSGINAIIYYAKQIFERIVSSEEALNYTYYLGLLQTAVTLVSGFLINSYGRRTLMLAGSLLVVLSLISAFLLDAFMDHSEIYVVVMIFLHVVGFSLSLGPVTFIYAAQIMEDISFIISVNWILTILVSLFSELMIKYIGIGRVFLFYGLCSLACLVYLYRFMIESKGLSRAQLVFKLTDVKIPKGVQEQRISLKNNDNV